jgi:hypothetical protein
VAVMSLLIAFGAGAHDASRAGAQTVKEQGARSQTGPVARSSTGDAGAGVAKRLGACVPLASVVGGDYVSRPCGPGAAMR